MRRSARCRSVFRAVRFPQHCPQLQINQAHVLPAKVIWTWLWSWNLTKMWQSSSKYSTSPQWKSFCFTCTNNSAFAIDHQTFIGVHSSMNKNERWEKCDSSPCPSTWPRTLLRGSSRSQSRTHSVKILYTKTHFLHSVIKQIARLLLNVNRCLNTIKQTSH